MSISHAGRLRSLREENLRLLAENTALRQIAVEIHWMARRYADGRMSYAVSMHNDNTRTLLEMGVKLNPTGDGTLWAKDGMRTETQFCDLDDAYFEPGHPLATGQVLGLLPNRRLSRDLEAVLGADPLRAVVRYMAAMKVVEAVQENWVSVEQHQPKLSQDLRILLDAFWATNEEMAAQNEAARASVAGIQSALPNRRDSAIE